VRLRFAPKPGQPVVEYVAELDRSALYAAFGEASKQAYLLIAAADYDNTPEATHAAERAVAISAALDDKCSEGDL
jgi:hypothetical protein